MIFIHLSSYKGFGLLAECGFGSTNDQQRIFTMYADVRTDTQKLFIFSYPIHRSDIMSIHHERGVFCFVNSPVFEEVITCP